MARLHLVRRPCRRPSPVSTYVQENTPEKRRGEARRFSPISTGYAPPDAVLASSTSALLPSAFLEHVPGRARCLVCHPINPPYLIPAVEVVPSPWTSPETVERAADFLRGCGQAPLVMKREIDGFIMNRLQGALLEEAFRLVADGVAGVEDVDIGIRDGPRVALVLHGAVRDHRPQRAGRRARLCRALPGHLRPASSRPMQRRVDWTGPVMEDGRGRRARKCSAATSSSSGRCGATAA